MEPGVFALVMFAALLHAGWNALAKARGGVDAVAIAMGSGLIALPLLPFAGAPAITSWPALAVAAAREMSVVFAAILGVLFLRERLGVLRWEAVALTAAGMIGIRYA